MLLFYDWTYFLVIIGAVLSLWASAGVKSSFSKFSKVLTAHGVTAYEAAERILHGAGIYDVKIERVSGSLTDHYDSSSKILRLSDTVYHSTSVAAVGVAAHECGHAIQDHEEYAPLRLRHYLVPVVNFGNRLSMPLFLIGLLLGAYNTLVPIGIFLFSFAVVFQFVTLPVEFNASSRAVTILGESGMVTVEELPKVKKVLKAAAYTYLAAAASSALQLLRLILISRRRRN
ncbi:MAG: zinc metallopeptidase [Lachnospiraceae bacterium]|nr:zinc metallopeptidase [Lachnospiraceae bacterium]